MLTRLLTEYLFLATRAEVSKVAETFWIMMKEPRFLPDHIDGRYLFDAATQMYEAQKVGKEYEPPSLGAIVMVEPVKDARERNVLRAVRPFDHFTQDSLVWSDGRKEKSGCGDLLHRV
jgi:putative flavoprotein involved in K+ transport